MSNFIQALENHQNSTTTENGQPALASTSNSLVDFFATLGSMRNASDSEVISKFQKAFQVDPLLAMKTIFYARNIRGGLGERKVVRTLLRYTAINHPEILIKNLHVIPHFGRWDDFFCLLDTPIAQDVYALLKAQLQDDFDSMIFTYEISLLGKWLPTPDTSSSETRKLARKVAKGLNMTIKQYTKNIRILRKYLNVVEVNMSAREWNKIKYENVPSNAMSNYINSFRRNDTVRYEQYVNFLTNGRARVNASTLYPYNIMQKSGLNWHADTFTLAHPDSVLEAQWNSLPNYIDGSHNILVMADTSASMDGRPINTSIGLALYFAERNTGIYKDVFMTFSSKPSFVRLQGKTLSDKVSCIPAIVANTNIATAFDLILQSAIKNNISQDDLPKSLVIISDMQFDLAISNSTHNYSTFYEGMKKKFQAAGYLIPEIIFWNVNNRRDTFHSRSDIPGVRMYSGQSVSTFNSIIRTIGKTAYQAMIDTLNDPVYNVIKI